MNNNIGAAFRGEAGLTNSYFEALVTASMAPYKLAVDRAKKRQSTLEIKSAVYNDLGTKLTSLHDAIAALRATQTGSSTTSVFDSKKVTSSDSTYATATADSTATDAAYDLHIDNLAVQHNVWSDQQTSNFTLNLGGSGNTASFKIRTGTDVNKDVAVTVADGDSLNDIRDKINTAVQSAVTAGTITSSDAFTASVVDNRLVVQADSTGTAFALAASDTSGTVLTDLNILAGVGDTDADSNGFVDINETTAEDAQFTVNGISVTRSSNTGLTDVITGVTLDLKQEHGTGNTNTITLTVAPDNSAVESAINKFISALNDFSSWMAAKSGVTDNQNGTYTRGVLASDFSLKGLRRNLVQTTFTAWSAAPGTATYTRLSEIGFDIGDNLTVSLDSSKLSTALSTNYSDVSALFEGVMASVQTLVDPYTEGVNTLVDKLKTSADSALDTQKDRVTELTKQQTNQEDLVRNRIAQQFAAISSYNSTGRFIMTTMFSTFG